MLTQNVQSDPQGHYSSDLHWQQTFSDGKLVRDHVLVAALKPLKIGQADLSESTF